MTTQEQLDRLTGIVDALATTVVAHDNQIEGLIKIAEQHESRFADLGKKLDVLAEVVAQTQREWQAYLRRLPPH